MKTLLIAGFSFLSAAGAFAQSTAPAFEAASIKPSKADPGDSGWHSRTGYLVMRNQTLRQCIQIAYHVQDYQVSGGPKWLDSDRFDIEARAAGPAKDPELLAMLQTLLAERFQLTFHHESKPHETYALLVAKNGLKIQPVEGGSGSRSRTTKGRIMAERVSMAKVAEILSRVAGEPVVDFTNTPGAFSFKLEWAPENTQVTARPDGDANVPLGPSLFTAVQEQLGLKLEPRKVPVDILVIDRAERPSEN